jgi:hypothetical protein
VTAPTGHWTVLARVALGESQEELGVRGYVFRVTGSIERADHPASMLAYTRLARLTEIVQRYGPELPVAKSMYAAAPEIRQAMAAVERWAWS